MQSNEVLEERISNMEKQNNKEHTALSVTLDKVVVKLNELDEKLENKFVMRRE